ncbi:MAG: UDP-N-acetylmuramoyl-tripeptide--D-alanyl-D-alanine ligase, partial [Tissierellia bacterium]|nr:UDP-N-acetylmuramoyl-tripeptide--D-alanyl-D-alanine ligase [Tissierellia bacterium]
MLNIISIIFLVFIAGDFLKRSESSLHLFQLEGYDLKKYNTWLRNNPEKLFSVGKLIESDKTPLVYTDRALRLKKTHTIINILIGIILFFIGYIMQNSFLYLLVVLLFVFVYIMEPYIINITANINAPKEKAINMGFYKTAQEKIRKMSNLTVVGITGSYGKTSTKFITSTILKERFNVQDTPSSYNTPMGLSKVINNELTDDKEVFVAEMGAYVKGEIKEVADLVQPDIGIITSIGPAHLESFGSIENIINTKYEIIESLNEDGIAVFNYDDENLKRVADSTKLKKYYYGFNDTINLDVYAKDVSVNSRGSTFTLVIKELGEIGCSTKMLGKHNIGNILAGCTVGYILGLTLEEIAIGVTKIQPVEHRLNIIDPGTGIIIIDDGFNSNPSGAKAALEVLNEFKTGRRFVVTPGMVELGEIEYEENKKFGTLMGEVADFVFLVGK